MERLQIDDNIHKLQEHVPKSADVSKGGLEAVGSHYIPWFTLRRFLGLLLAPEAVGDVCGFGSCPLLAPFWSMTSEPTFQGRPSDCDVALWYYGAKALLEVVGFLRVRTWAGSLVIHSRNSEESSECAPLFRVTGEFSTNRNS
jgi:hypothetical protein